MGGCLGISNETILDTRKEPQRDKHKGYQWGREIGGIGGLNCSFDECNWILVSGMLWCLISYNPTK